MPIFEALIFLPKIQHAAHWLPQCAHYCLQHGYRVQAVVSHWDDVLQYVRDGFIGVIVVPPPSPEMPAAQARLPRIERADEPPRVTREAPAAQGQRRVRRRRT